MAKQEPSGSTRERILIAAGELFASKGFSATTVRDICDRAQANVAAVNYHFGDKQKLHAELLVSMERDFRETYVEQLIDRSNLPLEERLYEFVYGFLIRRLDPDREEWKTILFHNELMKAHSPAIDVLRELINLEQQILQGIVREFFPDGTALKLIMHCCHCVTGQAFFMFHVHGPIFHKVFKKLDLPHHEGELTREGIAEMARHVTEFSLAGIARFSSEAGAVREVD